MKSTWVAWLTNLVDTKFQFSSLQTLEIYPFVTQTGLSAVLTLIKRTAPTLSELWIHFRDLTCKEAKHL